MPFEDVVAFATRIRRATSPAELCEEDLAARPALPTSGVMSSSHTRPHLIRTTLVVLGFLIMAASPLVGIVPGPGGIIVFAGGLVLVLKNATWARRYFARLKRRWPRFGHYSDLALRRRSFRRRQQRARDIAMAEAEAAVLGFPAEPR